MTDPGGRLALIIAADGTVEADDSTPARPRERDAEGNETPSARRARDRLNSFHSRHRRSGAEHAAVPAIATEPKAPATRREAPTVVPHPGADRGAGDPWMARCPSRASGSSEPEATPSAPSAPAIHEVSQHWRTPHRRHRQRGKGARAGLRQRFFSPRYSPATAVPASSPGTTTRRGARSDGGPSRGRTMPPCLTSSPRQAGC